MFTQSSRRAIGVVAIGALGLVGVGSAQDMRSSGSDVMTQLLAEVRALRTEITRTAGASMRMQLLIGRLSLQEQRIDVLNRHATEVQARLAAAMRMRQETVDQLTIMQTGAVPGDELRSIEDGIGPFRNRLSEQEQQERVLQAQLAELSSTILMEQGRWKEFNGQLELLERALPTSAQH